jgi:nitrogen-specific signal transduction histidine kinase
VTRTPMCLLYSRDPDLAREFGAYLRDHVALEVMQESEPVRAWLRRTQAGLCILDLTQPDALDHADAIQREHPGIVALAVGPARSEPALAAEALNLFAVEAPDAGRQRWQALARSAVRHFHLVQENRFLKAESAPKAASPGDPAAPSPAAADGTVGFSEAFRHFEDVPAFLARVVEDVARSARVARAGLFTLDRGSGAYRCVAGVRCLPGSRDLVVPATADLVGWLTEHAHVVFRGALGHVREFQDRMMLTQALDTFGAELIVPLYGRDRMMGWLFAGHRVTGAPLEDVDIERISSLAEHAALLLDNALLYDEMTVQKTLAETVLQSIPIGIVAADADGRVRWFNEAAERLLDIAAASVIGEPVARLGGRLSHLLLQAIEGGDRSGGEPTVWLERATGRTLSALPLPLRGGSAVGLGAVAMIHDLTQERLLRSRQEELDRTAFWTELAAAMSHEVRNPLVAISTFAQLLPERYADEEFRRQFSGLVAQEIGRLNGMIEQINVFANPPDLAFAAIKVDVVLAKAVRVALGRVPGSGARIERAVAPDLPRLWGDETALVDALGHLIANSLEAVEHSPEPLVEIEATLGAGGGETVAFVIRDNGRGIAAGVGDKVFSPFYTTKARGIGLGLPIARRTLTDHNGGLSVQSDGGGTTVKVRLPAHVPEREFHEARVGG